MNVIEWMQSVDMMFGISTEMAQGFGVGMMFTAGFFYIILKWKRVI